jgi:hypothetical protein
VVNEGVALFTERAQERSNLCWKVAGKTLHPLCSRRPSDVRRNVIGSNMSFGHTLTPKMAGKATFYQNPAAQRSRTIATGRWATAVDRKSFADGYTAAYDEALAHMLQQKTSDLSNVCCPHARRDELGAPQPSRYR